KFYGHNDPTPTYHLTGFVNGEHATSAGVTGSPTCSIAAHSDHCDPHPFPTRRSSDLLTATNYSFIAGTKGTLTINKVVLSVNADPQSKIHLHSGQTPTYNLTGFVNGENATSAGVTGSPTCSIAAHSENYGAYPNTYSC